MEEKIEAGGVNLDDLRAVFWENRGLGGGKELRPGFDVTQLDEDELDVLFVRALRRKVFAP